MSLGSAAQEPRLQLPSRPRLDELAADGLEERVRHRCRPERAEPPQAADRPAEERIVGEPTHELAVVGVRSQDEPQALQGRLRALSLDRDGKGAVGTLVHARDRRPAVGHERDGQDPFPEVARRVALHACRKRERVRPARDNGRLEKHRSRA